MFVCEVPKCNISSIENPGNFKFHPFPTNRDFRNLWLILIRRWQWKPRNNSSVCSRHFDSTCYTNRGANRTLLPGSFPTIFMLEEDDIPQQSFPLLHLPLKINEEKVKVLPQLTLPLKIKEEKSPDPTPDEVDFAPRESQLQMMERHKAKAAALELGTKRLEMRIRDLERENKASKNSLGVYERLVICLARRCNSMQEKNDTLRIRLRATGYSSSDDERPPAKRTNPAPLVDKDSGAEDVGNRN